MRRSALAGPLVVVGLAVATVTGCSDTESDPPDPATSQT